jgi:hypothetical protein
LQIGHDHPTVRVIDGEFYLSSLILTIAKKIAQ